MAGAQGADGVLDRLDDDWPPLGDVRRGLQRLDDEGRARVDDRLEVGLASFEPPADVNEAALRRFFSYLAQVEVIAIDVPLLALPEADEESVPLLERQLADEVFHALLFAELAEQMGGLDDPIPEARELLETIRAPEDLETRAVLLNLIAEEWIETLFEHAVTWGVADPVFEIVLADEGRHIEEGHVHAGEIDPETVREPVRELEAALFALMQSPRVMLPTLALAGEAEIRELSRDYVATHEEVLAEIGLEPAEGFDEMATMVEEIEADAEPLGADRGVQRVEPESQWRETALHLWDTPRDPVMHGWFDVETEPIPDPKLTPVVVAAVGRVWHEYPRINRYTMGGELYEPEGVNVGVRVAVGDSQEALSTIVIPEAHQRSVQDIERILDAGVREMTEIGDQLEGLDPAEGTEPLRDVLRDEELMGMVPPETVAAPVTVSNVGSAGLVAGTGAMPGALGQSVELIVGRQEQRPSWNGQRYVPADQVTIGASADHRVVDGHHSAQAMDRIREALSEDGVEEILAREDTIPEEADLAETALASSGVSAQQAQLMLSCKGPFWMGWLCWLFKK